MSYFTTETQAVTGPGSEFARGPGIGYPTGDATHNTYWPTTVALTSTTNPAGNPNSPQEVPASGAFFYGFKTWEQKWAAMVPPGTPAILMEVAASEPYATGSPQQLTYAEINGHELAGG